MKNLCHLLAAALTVFAAETAKAEPKPLTLADPFVLSHGGKYYAYGTWSGNGIAVAVSGDLHTWKLGGGRAAEGLAMHKDDSYGEHSFWAPEVYERDGKFIMF